MAGVPGTLSASTDVSAKIIPRQRPALSDDGAEGRDWRRGQPMEQKLSERGSPGSAPVAPTGVDDNDEYAERIRSTK